jgi:hypothetical protein
MASLGRMSLGNPKTFERKPNIWREKPHLVVFTMYSVNKSKFERAFTSRSLSMHHLRHYANVLYGGLNAIRPWIE